MTSLRPPPHLEGVLLYLESSTFLGRKWDKRYVKILRSTLNVSRDEIEYEKGNILERVELLQLDIYEVFIPNSAKSHVFKVSGGENIELCFSCNTANECTRWITTLTTIKEYWKAYSKVELKRSAHIKAINCKFNDSRGKINTEKKSCDLKNVNRKTMNTTMDPSKEHLNGHVIPPLPKDSFLFTLVMEDHSEITMTLSKSATYHDVIDVLLQNKNCPDCRTCRRRRTVSRLYLVNSSGQINEVDKDTILYPFFKAKASFYLAEEKTIRLIVIHFNDKSFLPCLVKQDITTRELLDHSIYKSRFNEIGPIRNLNLVHKIDDKISLCTDNDTPVKRMYDTSGKPMVNGRLLFQSINQRFKNMLNEQNEDRKQEEIMERAKMERLRREEEDALKSKVKHALRENKAASRTDFLGAVPDITDAYDAIKTERGQMRFRHVTLSSGQVIMEPYQSDEEDEDEGNENEDGGIDITVLKEGGEPFVMVSETRSVINEEIPTSLQGDFREEYQPRERSNQISNMVKNTRAEVLHDMKRSITDSPETKGLMDDKTKSPLQDDSREDLRPRRRNEQVSVFEKITTKENSSESTKPVQSMDENSVGDMSEEADISLESSTLNSSESFIDSEEYSDMESYNKEHFKVNTECKGDVDRTVDRKEDGGLAAAEAKDTDGLAAAAPTDTGGLAAAAPKDTGGLSSGEPKDTGADSDEGENTFYDAISNDDIQKSNKSLQNELKNRSERSYPELILVEEVCHLIPNDGIVNAESESDILNESENEINVNQSQDTVLLDNKIAVESPILVQDDIKQGFERDKAVAKTIEDMLSASTFSLIDEMSGEIEQMLLEKSMESLSHDQNLEGTDSFVEEEVPVDEQVDESIEDMLISSSFSGEPENDSSLQHPVQITEIFDAVPSFKSSETRQPPLIESESRNSIVDTCDLKSSQQETKSNIKNVSELNIISSSKFSPSVSCETEMNNYQSQDKVLLDNKITVESPILVQSDIKRGFERELNIISSSKFSPSNSSRFVCDLCTRMGDDKPLLIKTKELMKWVMGQSSRNSSVSYICLLGTHFRCTDEGWDLADNCRISYDGDNENVSSDKSTKFNLGNGFVCTWIPKNNNNPPRWMIKQIGEVPRVNSPIVDIDVYLPHPTIPTCEYDDEDDFDDDSMSLEDSFELPSRPPTSTSQMFDSVINTIKETTNNINTKKVIESAEEKTKIFVKSARHRLDSISRKHFNTEPIQNDTIPFNNGVLPANLHDFQSLYTKPLQIVVLNIVNQFEGLPTEKQRQKGNDVKTPSTGWLVRNDLCTVIAKILRIGLTDGRSFLTSLFSRPVPLTLWKVIKDFTSSFDSTYFALIINQIDNNKWLLDDDMKFRFFICDLLNKSTSDGREKLLIHWLRLFASESTKIDKYYLESSFWRMDYKEHFVLLFEEILLCMMQLNNVPFFLHDYFEFQLMQLSRDTPMLTEPQAKRANHDIVCVLE